MSVKPSPELLPKRLFSFGEIKPALRARPDTDVFQGGLALCRNFTVSKTGGLRNRPGTRFVGPVAIQTSQQRLLEFDYADGQNDSYAVGFSAGLTRFFKNRIPVFENPVSIESITQAAPGVFQTNLDHSFNTGDALYLKDIGGMVELDKFFGVAVVLSNTTFSLTDINGNEIDTTNFGAFTVGGTVSRVYQIKNPFASPSLAYLNYDQSFDEVVIANGVNALQDLIHYADTDWTIGDHSFLPSISAPANVLAATAGNASTWLVTAIKQGTGEESLGGTAEGAAPTNTITWDAVQGALFYKIYRMDINSGGSFGLLQIVPAVNNPSFVDTGFTPNYNETPPGIVGTLFSFGFELDRQDAATVFPKAALPGNGNCIAWSPDETMVAVGTSAAPYLLIYSFQNDSFTLLTTPFDTPPAAAVNAVAWSPDGTYLAAAAQGSGGVYAYLYKKNGNFFTQNTSWAGNAPNGNTLCAAWMMDSSCVAFGGNGGRYLWVYERAGDTFSLIPKAAVLYPSASVNCLMFMPWPYGQDYGNPNPDFWTPRGFLIVGGNAGFFAGGYGGVTSYYLFPPGFATDPYTGPANTWLVVGGQALTTAAFPELNHNVLSVIFNETGPQLYNVIFGLAAGNFVENYTLTNPGGSNTAHFHVQPSPGTLPDGAVNGIAQTNAGTLIVLATAGTQKLLLYDLIAGALVFDNKQPTPDMTDVSTGCSFSPDGQWLGVTQKTTSPYTYMYSTSLVHPVCVGFGQERLRIANIKGNPSTEYDSAENAYTNFAIRALATDIDPIQFTSWSRKYNAIKHLLSLKKLIQITTNGVIVLEGDAVGTITPNLQNPRITGYNGGNYVRPCLIGDTALYVGATANKVYDLKKEVTASSYFSSDNFFVTDLTDTFSHYLRGRKLTWSCYQEKPDSIAWFGVDDGTFISLTYNKEQGIFGWAHHDIGALGGAKVLDGCCVRESDGTDRVYLVVELLNITAPGQQNSGPYKVTVALEDRDNTDPSSQFFVDCGAIYDGRNTDETILLSEAGGTLSSDVPFFTDDMVGKHIRLGEVGKSGWSDFEINTITSSYIASGTLVSSGAGGHPAGSSSAWAWLSQSVNGLWHLEAQPVAVSVDGGVVASPNNSYLKQANGTAAFEVQIQNGIADFSNTGLWGAVIIAGLPITADVQTLEWDTPQGSSYVEVMKNIDRVNVKVDYSKGLFFSNTVPSNDTSAGMKQGYYGNRQSTQDTVPTAGAGGINTPLLTKTIKAELDGSWEEGAQTFIRQVDPSPAEIVGIFLGTAK